MAKILCNIDFRIIKPRDTMTPIMYLPMQKTSLFVEEPVTHSNVVAALANEFDGVERGDIHNLQFWRAGIDKIPALEE